MGAYCTSQPGVVLGDVWQVLRHIIEVAERFADGLATETERKVDFGCESKRAHQQRRPQAFSLWPFASKPPQGFEPWTPALRKLCSTAELRRRTYLPLTS